MLSGRELDNAVAEHVFGWKRKLHSGLVWFFDGDVPVYASGDDNCAWSPSTDIGEVFRVVDEMAKRGLTLTLYSPGAPGDQGTAFDETQWTAVFQHPPGFDYPNIQRIAIGKGESAAEAICRAAVNAMEGK